MKLCSNILNVAKWNLGQVKHKTMLASGISQGWCAGRLGDARRGFTCFYSLASDVKSFCICVLLLGSFSEMRQILKL